MSRPNEHDELRRMLSAYLDGELTQADEQRTRLHLEECESCRRELEQMREIQRLTADMQFADPLEENMEALEKRLSVQAPRRLGWGMILIALAAWLVYLTVHAFRHPRWPTLPELLTGAVLAGVLLLFLSVIRQRWLERPRDRYRKVRR